MARVISICLVLLMFVYAGCDTAGNVEPAFKHTYIRYYGTEGDQSAADLVINEDGTMYILSNSTSPSGALTSSVIKVDPEGNVIWQTDVGTINQRGVDLEPVIGNPNQLVVALNIENEAGSSIYLVKLSQDGIASAPVAIPMHPNGGFRQVVKSVTSLSTGDFVITGYADRTLISETSPVDETNDQTDILAFHLDSDFNLIDNIVTKGGEHDGCGIKVFELDGVNAGKLVLFSYTDRPFLTDGFGYNFSFDILNEGTPVGKLVGTESEQEILSSVVKVPFLRGGGYLMAGTAKTSMDAPGDIYLVKYDDEFQQKAIDSRVSLGVNLQCVSADHAESGYYLLANEVSAPDLKDITLVKVDRKGALEWTKKFGSRDGDDVSAAVATLPDGRIAIVGTIELVMGKKIALIVVKSNGNF